MDYTAMRQYVRDSGEAYVDVWVTHYSRMFNTNNDTKFSVEDKPPTLVRFHENRNYWSLMRKVRRDGAEGRTRVSITNECRYFLTKDDAMKHYISCKRDNLDFLKKGLVDLNHVYRSFFEEAAAEIIELERKC